MAGEEERHFFGPYLQTVRLSARISLEQVAEATRIAPSTLAAIDAEELDRLPPPVFLKGFLRAYAQAVGADGEEAVRRYELAVARRQLLAGEKSGRAPRRRGGGARRLVISLLLLAAIIAVTLWVFGRTGRGFAPPAAVSAVPQAAAAAVAEASRPEAPLEPAAAQRAARPAGRQVLVIQAREDGWVKAVADHQSPSEHTLKAGERLRLEAEQGFNLLLGNAGGLALTLNGKPLPAVGKRGETVNIHLP